MGLFFVKSDCKHQNGISLVDTLEIDLLYRTDPRTQDIARNVKGYSQQLSRSKKKIIKIINL